MDEKAELQARMETLTKHIEEYVTGDLRGLAVTARNVDLQREIANLRKWWRLTVGEPD